MNSTGSLKKHQCDKCSFASSRKFNLQRHYKRRHDFDTVTSLDQLKAQTQPPSQPESIKGQLITPYLPKSEFARSLMYKASDYEANKVDANLITEHFKLKDYYMSMRNKYKNLAKMEKESILELLKRRKTRKTISKCDQKKFKKDVM